MLLLVLDDAWRRGRGAAESTPVITMLPEPEKVKFVFCMIVGGQRQRVERPRQRRGGGESSARRYRYCFR